MLGNRLFYNGSKYDGNNTAINGTSDALAIAPDKIGYVGSASSSTFANVSSFTKGITGVMVDLQSGIGAHASITTADITFKTSPAFSGTYNNVGAWGTGPAPAAMSVILGGGTGGSDRVEITWNVNAIKNEWLEVNVAADANTGLSSPDIFFFGSAAGDSGENTGTTQITVNGTDVTAQRNNLVGPTTSIYNAVDFNRDGLVNGSDGTQGPVANNAFVLHFIKNPTGPFAPSGDAGISSGLAATSSAAAVPAPSNASLSGSLAAAGGLQPNDVARYFQALAVAEASATKRPLVAADEVAETALDDELVDALLADLGLA